MTNKDKLKMCALRLEGRSIRDVAKVLGVSTQTVSNVLNKLPQTQKDERGYPQLEPTLMLLICKMHIAGNSIQVIMDETNLSQDEVLSVFRYITMRKPIAIKKSAFPAITDWMQKHYHTVRSLSALVDVSPSALRAILTGEKKHMPFALALQLKDITGIPMKEMFAEDLKELRREIGNE